MRGCRSGEIKRPCCDAHGHGERVVIKAYRLGLDDFVLKRDLRVSELLGAIERAVARRDEEDNRAAELDKLQRRSAFDTAKGNCRDLSRRVAAGTPRGRTLASEGRRRGREPAGGRGQSGQIELPRDDEPRNPDAAEFDHWVH